MQLLKDRLDVMAAVDPGDEACCTVLYALKLLQLAQGAVEQSISHVQPRYNEGVEGALGGVNSQKRANAPYVAQVVIGPADMCRHGQVGVYSIAPRF